jgi:hypothetical protein
MSGTLKMFILLVRAHTASQRKEDMNFIWKEIKEKRNVRETGVKTGGASAAP